MSQLTADAAPPTPAASGTSPRSASAPAGQPDHLSITRSGSNWVLRCESVLDRPLDEVFPFFADARNLESITPPLLNFEVLTPEPIEMREGLLLDYRLKVHGLPLRWRTEIPVWEPPVRFVDQALKSPYTLWHHEHTFIPNSDGGTLVRDVVTYRPKGWLLAGLINTMFVQRDLLKIFRYRTAKIAEHFAPVD